jgi:RNA methyltransferase, TrmH family
MTYDKNISSNQVKKYSKLKQKKFRHEYKLFLVEGKKQCFELFGSDNNYEAIILRKDFSDETEKIIAGIDADKILIAGKDDFAKISDAETPQDIIAIAEIPTNKMDYSGNYICLESVADPGNLGTILRTCLWFGIKNIILSEDSADIFNPKVVRSTMGALFKLNIVYTDNIIEYVNQYYPEHKSIGASLKASKKIDEIIIPEHFGLYFGNESKGLSQFLENSLDTKYIIGECDEIESLNLSVSAGISLYYFCQDFTNK